MHGQIIKIKMEKSLNFENEPAPKESKKSFQCDISNTNYKSQLRCVEHTTTEHDSARSTGEWLKNPFRHSDVIHRVEQLTRISRAHSRG